MARFIVPPRVPFIDPRTNTIAREWFFYLLKEQGLRDDADVSAAFDAAIGVAATGELAKVVDDTNLTASYPFPPQDASGDIQDVRLLQPRIPVDDFGPDIDASRLAAPRSSQDFAPDIQDGRLLAAAKAEQGTSAARIAGRVLVGL